MNKYSFLRISERTKECIEQDNIIYSINFKDNTATILESKSEKEEIIIPRTITFESIEFVIKCIRKFAFHKSKAKSIQFAADSEILTIESDAFHISQIESFSIPASLVDIQEGWCERTPNLTKINVSPDNPRYKKIEGKIIVAKLSLESDIYDSIFFGTRDIETVTIPSHIKKIEGFAFENCKNLKNVVISENSELRTIGENSFLETQIESFTIPPHLTEICGYSFYNCKKLKTVEIPENSELLKIGHRSFYGTSIETLKIPPHLTQICSSAFSFCERLKMIEIPENSELQIIESKAFLGSSIERFTVPLHLTRIGESAFSNCEQFKLIEIPKNSELQTIQSHAFFGTSIEKFTIPLHLTQLNEYVFGCNISFQAVEFPPESKLQSIEKFAFDNTSIDNLTIPSTVIDLKEGWCDGTPKLTNITISLKNPRYKKYGENFIIKNASPYSRDFDTLVFCSRNVKTVVIPSFIKHIEGFAFKECKKLQMVEIPKNSKLQTIGKYAFTISSIECFTIPLHLRKISNYSFTYCKEFKIIEVAENSELEEIDKDAFDGCNELVFMVPAKFKFSYKS